MAKRAASAVVKFSQLKVKVDQRISTLGEAQSVRKQRLQRVSENLMALINANRAVVRGDVYSAVLLCALTSVVSVELRAIADELEL